jgi:hypothetical protein
VPPASNSAVKVTVPPLLSFGGAISENEANGPLVSAMFVNV